MLSDLASGKKRQTIRKVRKKGNPRKGDTLYLYVGHRTKQGQLVDEVFCKSVSAISMGIRNNQLFVVVDGILLSDKELSELAVKDGFRTVSDFRQFFNETYGYPFNGLLIRW